MALAIGYFALSALCIGIIGYVAFLLARHGSEQDRKLESPLFRIAKIVIQLLFVPSWILYAKGWKIIAPPSFNHLGSIHKLVQLVIPPLCAWMLAMFVGIYKGQEQRFREQEAKKRLTHPLPETPTGNRKERRALQKLNRRS